MGTYRHIMLDHAPLDGLGTLDLRVVDDAQREAVWAYMSAKPRPCFTPSLLDAIHALFDAVEKRSTIDSLAPRRYVILASDIPGVFNLGGDLQHFRHCIDAGNYSTLLGYGEACIRAVYRAHTAFGCDLTTISLVQGVALGGGFEAALSTQVLIAERGSTMGFPEIHLNLFAGMGAFNLVSRRVGPTLAKRMMLTGEIYSAETLYDLGLVDVLAEPGQGEDAVRRHIAMENRLGNGYRAIRRVERLLNPIRLHDLRRIVEIWASTALKATPRDLRLIDRIIARQTLTAPNDPSPCASEFRQRV